MFEPIICRLMNITWVNVSRFNVKRSNYQIYFIDNLSQGEYEEQQEHQCNQIVDSSCCVKPTETN